MTDERQSQGRRGEDLAVRLLKKNGYKILETNYRSPLGEIDIIASRRGVLVFVEVKTRTSNAFGHPKGAVTRRKQRKISMVALEYLKRNAKPGAKARFDVVAVHDGPGQEQIEIIQNAFELAYP